MEVRGLTLSFPEAEAMDVGSAKFDLTLFLFEEGDRVRGTFEYNSDLFEPATVQRLLGHFENLLTTAVAQPERPMVLLPLLTEAEGHQLAREWNDVASAYPSTAGLQELFEEQVRRTPEAPAVICGDRVLSSAELNRRANRLAHRLRAVGVGAGQGVGLCLERSPEIVVGMVGIVKAGGAYVPLDPDYPEERLAFMAEDSDLQVLVGEEGTVARLPRELLVRTEVLLLAPEPGPDSAGHPSDQDPEVLSDGSSLAYVTYTSGSTGRPKGVAVPHQAIVRLVRETNYMLLGAGDRMGQVANINFDAATWEVWGPLLNGAAVVVIPRDVSLVPVDLAAALRDQRITSNTSLFVLDRWQSLAPQGVAGELCIGGDGLSRGYWNQPALTAERFVPHPWEAGGRLYRTGDLVRRRADGAIEFLGRLDHQVKIRGFRIELGEIETRLGETPRCSTAW